MATYLNERNLKGSSATGLLGALQGCNTAITSDTIDLETLSICDLDGTTLNPTIALEGLKSTDVFYHLWVAAKRTLEDRSALEWKNAYQRDTESTINLNRDVKEGRLTEAVFTQFLVEIGSAMLDRVSGPHLTFVDPRYHNNAEAMVRQAREIISKFEKNGIVRSKVIISIPATENGLIASRSLEDEQGISTNLMCVSGTVHAAACAKVGASAATISVGPLLRWYEMERNRGYSMRTHPGIKAILSTIEYFRLHSVKTMLIGANFRQLTEVAALGELDAISASKEQLESLRWSRLPLSTSPPPSSSASLLVQEAHHPTELLTSKPSLMNAVSVESYSMVAGTLYVTLGRMKVEMEQLESVIDMEIHRRVSLATLDLKMLYAATTPKRRATQQSFEGAVPEVPENYIPIYDEDEDIDIDDGEYLLFEDESHALYTNEGLIEGEEYF